MSYRRDVNDDPYSDGLSNGYGSYDKAQRVAAPTYLDRRGAQRRSPERDRTREHTRQVSGQIGERQVEDILRYVDQQWSFMAANACVPVKVALQLMDHSSLGLADQQDQFQRVHAQLQSALRSVVNDHHQGFNSSIGTFHQIQASIQASQQRVRDLRLALLDAKSNLGTARPELHAYATTSQEYDKMLVLLSQIQELQAIPAKSDALVTDKKFLGAVDVLHKGLRLVRNPDLADITALSELQLYLSNQEHSLADILVEELHNHLYLKSPYCESRWKQHLPDQPLNGNTSHAAHSQHYRRYLDSVDLSQPMTQDLFSNPEVDTFAYQRLLLESLNRLSRLDAALDAIEQRLPVEIARIVDKCYQDVQVRHAGRSTVRAHQDHLGTNQGPVGYRQAHVIDDILATMYARFEAIAESFRVSHEVLLAISRRTPTQDSKMLRSFHELWKIYQSQIRALLHDHLSTSATASGRSRRDNDISINIFSSHARDKHQKLFKLADTDVKSLALASEKEDLEHIFRASVPGLVSHHAAVTAPLSSETTADGSVASHKILVDPSVFNMSILLPISLSFLTKLKELVPPSSNIVISTLTSFLDDFLVNVFLPQLEDTIVDQCSTALLTGDMCNEDTNWQAHATRPVSKSAVQYYKILSSFCKLLDGLPAEQSFTTLIIAQIRVFYRRSREVYDSLMSRPELESGTTRKARRSAQLAEVGEVCQILKVKFEPGRQAEQPSEVDPLLSSTKLRPIVKNDLLTDPTAVCQLCTLYTSVRWFNAKVKAWRHVEAKKSERWARDTSSQLGDAPYLPLDQDTVVEFDGLTSYLDDLASLVLRTLYIELRIRILSSISRGLSTTYQLSQPYNDPDPVILELNNVILAFDADLSRGLPAQAHKLCRADLSLMVDATLMFYASEIPAMDMYGNARMCLNILVLQQNLREIDGDASLGQSSTFYGLWQQGPARIVEYASAGLDKTSAKTLLRLYFGQGNEEAVQDKHGLEYYITQVDGS